MKKQLLIALTLISYAALAQQNTFTKVHYDALLTGIAEHALCHSFDNGYMFAGTTSYNNDGFILKTDSAGNALWNKTCHLNSGGRLVFNAIAPTFDSCFIISGNSYNSASASSEGFFGKINAAGDTLWLRSIAFAGYTAISIQNINQASDSGYIMTGYADQSSFPYSKIFVAKTDASGSLLWAELLTEANYEGEGYSIKQMPDSSFLLIGYLSSTALNETDACFINLSATGSVNWANKYVQPSQFPSYGYDFEFTNDGMVSLVSTNGQMGLMKTDFAGNVSWAYSYSYFGGQQGSDMVSRLLMTSDSSLAFATGTCFFDGSLTKTDVNGTFLWNDNLFLIPLNVLETPGKELFVGGNGPLCGIRSQSVITPQIGIIQTDSMGTTVGCNNPAPVTPTVLSFSASPNIIIVLTGGIINSVQPVIDSLALISYTGCVDVIGGIEENQSASGITISPNPITNHFTVIFPNTISKGAIEIYNVLGEKIFKEDVINISQKEIHLKNIEAGIYFVQVKDGEKDYCEKLVIE